MSLMAMTTESRKNLWEKLSDLMTFFEKDRFNLVTGTLLLYSYILLRLVLEWTLLREPEAPVGVGLYNVYFNTFVFTSMFVTGILVMAVVSRIRVKKIVNVVLLGFALILLGPVIDGMIFERTEPYEFITVESIVGAGPGLFIQLYLILFLAAFYVWVRTESMKHTVAVFVLLNFAMVLMAFLPAYLGDFLADHFNSSNAIQVTAGMILFVLTIVIAGLVVYVANNRVPRAIIMGSKPHLTSIFLAVSVVGVIASGTLLLETAPDGDVTVIIADVPFVFLLLLTVFFACQFLFAMTSIFTQGHGFGRNGDDPLSRKVLSRHQYLQYSGFTALLALGFSLLCGPLSFLAIIIFITTVTAATTLGLASRKPVVPFIMGFEAAVVFFTGYFTTTAERGSAMLAIGFLDLRYPNNDSFAASSNALLAGTVIFLSVAFLWFILMRNKRG